MRILPFLQNETIAYALLLCFSMLLRFWGIARFNTLVFDEVYFANNGYYYLHQIPFFDIHPPLGKLLIALGIKIAHFLPFNNTIVTTTENWTLPTWHYRWLNAAIGSLIPLLGTALIQTLTRRKSFAFIAGILLALDGLLLVESRYALINIYLVFFGLLGHLLFFQALLRSPEKRSLWSRSVGFILAGLSLGACVSIKWNGLGFLLAIYSLWGLGMLSYLGRSLQLSQPLQKRPWRRTLFPKFLSPLRSEANFPLSATPSLSPTIPSTIPAAIPATIPGNHTNPDPFNHPSNCPFNHASNRPPALLQKMTILRPYHLFLYLGLLPAIVYRLQWIPHLHLNPDFNFWEVHRQIWNYNTNLGAGKTVHPYCSTWNTWPWLIRPIAYFFKEIKAPEDANLLGLSPTQLPRIYDVHAMGNPFLWWYASLAIVGLIVLLFMILGAFPQQLLPTSEPDILIYLVISYGTNWLPWSLVSRCLYLYHYMPASLFSFFALGWCIDRGIRSNDRLWKMMGWGTLALVFFSFIYWLPIYLGLSLSPAAFHQRMWLRSWY